MTSQERHDALIELLNVSQSITGFETPSAIEKHPKLIPVPGFAGRISLWHFPSQKQLMEIARDGCNCIVTLQAATEDPHIKLIQAACIQTGMEWIQLNFWQNYYQHQGSEGHPAITRLIDQICEKVKAGQSVMLHCAAGIHRTGILIYGVLRRLGFESSATLNLIKTMRSATYEHCGTDRFNEMEAKCRLWFNI